MGSLSIWHWLVVLLFMSVLYLMPACMILKKSGHHPAWAVVGLVPALNVIGLWFLALKKWPPRP
jgi:hypothetical protein